MDPPFSMSHCCLDWFLVLMLFLSTCDKTAVTAWNAIHSIRPVIGNQKWLMMVGNQGYLSLQPVCLLCWENFNFTGMPLAQRLHIDSYCCWRHMFSHTLSWNSIPGQVVPTAILQASEGEQRTSLNSWAIQSRCDGRFFHFETNLRLNGNSVLDSR